MGTCLKQHASDRAVAHRVKVIKAIAAATAAAAAEAVPGGLEVAVHAL